jgi:hypothetical protein
MKQFESIEMPGVVNQVVTGDFAAYNGDSIEVVEGIPNDSIGLSVFSPPFPGMYAYTNSPRDIGNCQDIDQMLAQFRFLSRAMLPKMMPGRRACVHMCQVPAFKWADGYVGIKDFRGRLIELMESEGWIYYAEVCIDKCPQLKAARTKDATLQMKTFCSNAEKLRPALADYLLMFTRPGECPEPIKAGTHPHHPGASGWLTSEQWISWAHPVWGDIRESRVLNNFRDGKEGDDEKHLCPLQLDVIERCVLLWSNPGDVVFSPFMGIGSEGFESVRLGRKFIGIELKPSYFKVAVSNLHHAVRVRCGGELLMDAAS